MPKNIEVEVRALISDAEYRRVKTFLKKRAKFLGRHRDRNTYFDREGRLRICIEPYGAFLKFKSGKIHARARKEVLIPIAKRDTPALERLLAAVGFPVVVRWSRKREKFLWRRATITLDNTSGYGRMIDIEKIVQSADAAPTYRELQVILTDLGLKPTSARRIRAHYQWYVKNWKRFY